MNREDWFFQLPDKDIGILDILFGLPNQWTNGQYINMLITGLYGTFFIAAMYMQDRPDIKDASVYAGAGTFIMTFGMVLLSSYTDATVAGENQLIPVTVLLLVLVIWNYVSDNSGGPTL